MPTAELPERCDVLMFGRELEEPRSFEIPQTKVASFRTFEIARAVASFWHAFPEKERQYRVRRIIASGGYPHLARGMLKPLDDSNEGKFMEDELLRLGVTSEIVVDDFPEHTFDNVSGAINLGLLARGQDEDRYSPNHPLVIAANGAHMERAYILTRHGLNIRRQDMRILRPYNSEHSVEVHEKETELTKLTQCAILESVRGGFAPGSSGCIEHVLEVFIDMWDDRKEHIVTFDNRNPEWSLRLPEIVDYPRLPWRARTPSALASLSTVQALVQNG